jgi:hypothetical protein
MKRESLFVIFVLSFVCLLSGEMTMRSKDMIFSVKSDYISSNFRNSSTEKNYFKSEDSKISFEPSINLILNNPKRTSHLYLNWKGEFIDSKAKCRIYGFNFDEDMLFYDDEVEMVQTGLDVGYISRIHNTKSLINYIDVSIKFDNYSSEYIAKSSLNSDLEMMFLTIEFGHVFNPIENSDMYFASTRKSDITEYYLNKKPSNFEHEFYFAPHIENNTFNYSYYTEYSFDELYKEEEQAIHQSFGVNFETRAIYNKNNLIAGLRFSLIYGVVLKDYWNVDNFPYDLRVNSEIFANFLLDKFIFTSRINVENENVFFPGINITRLYYVFFNEITFHLKKTFFFSLNYNFTGKKYFNCNSSSLLATEMDQIPEKLISKNLYNSNIGLSIKVIY